MIKNDGASARLDKVFVEFNNVVKFVPSLLALILHSVICAVAKLVPIVSPVAESHSVAWYVFILARKKFIRFYLVHDRHFSSVRLKV